MVCVKVQIVYWPLFSYHNRWINDWFAVRLQLVNIMLVPGAIPGHAEILWNVWLGIQFCNVLLVLQSGHHAWGCFSVWVGDAAVKLAVLAYGARPQTWSWIRPFC